jgi:prephenate dehydratase
VRLGYLGPPGTFGEEAAIRANPAAEHVPFPSHAAIAAAVEAGEADEGILAVENSLNGSVAETLDILIHDTSLTVQAEVVVPVVHNLVARPGTKLADIRVVYSHPHALNQCRRFIDAQLAGAQLEAALSTAEAVRMVVDRGGNVGAIGTRRAAELYGGEVLVPHIEDATNNVTRFVVLGRGGQPPTGRDRTSIAFTFAEDRPGSLAGVLNEFARRGISCSKIESRPTKTVFGEYVFVVDFVAHKDDALGREALEAIAPLCANVKVFGSYPRAV